MGSVKFFFRLTFLLAGLLCFLLSLLIETVHAQALVTVDTVFVGNAGNSAAGAGNAPSWGSDYGYGDVGYNYRIGRTEVTINQYATFLNAVAAIPAGSFQADLWNPSMQTNAWVKGISRSGSGTIANPFSYSVLGSGNRPITYVNFYEAAAFTNWLSNGATVSSGILTGAYTISVGGISEVSRSANVATLRSDAHTLSVGDQVTISGTTSFNGSAIVTVVTPNTFSFVQIGSDQSVTASSGNLIGASATRNVGAGWWLPSEDEWMKAAYYDPTLNSGDGGYSLYANRSDSLLTNTIGAPGGANFYDGDFATTGQPNFTNTENYLTDAGAYPESLSYYGTLDQAGNVSEWNEALPTESYRGIRGGDWLAGEVVLRAPARGFGIPDAESPFIGFRVASIPEPSTIILLGLGCSAFLWTRRRRI